MRRPVPFRTRKLRPGRGDGTALERVWESSTPPHSTYGPSGRAPSGFPEGPFLFPHTGVSSAHWRFRDAGRTAGGMIPPPTGCFVPPEGPWAGGFLHPLGVPGRWGIPGIPGELPALIRWWNRLGNHALFRTQTLRRIEQNQCIATKRRPGRPPTRAGVNAATELWVYRCEFCGTWHLTHRDPQSSYTYVPFNQQIKPHSRKKGYKPQS